MTTKTLRRTALYKIHREAGGRMVDFHGWELPVQFSTIMKEHGAVRTACGIFDVSHMGQVNVEGPQALAFLDRVNSNDISRLTAGRAMYSHMLNEQGGVVDDVIVSRLGPERCLVVVNAATRTKDVSWLRRNARGMAVTIEDRSDDYGMVALQGPQAAKIIESVAPGAGDLKRFGVAERELYGLKCVLTRTGYTGEDGFEIVVPLIIMTRIWRTLSVHGASFGLLPCGLGARDTLRLEAGYLLYGADIDDDHTPYEAGYGWVVKLSKKDFLGKAALEEQKRAGVGRRLLGIKLRERGVPRPGARVLLKDRELGRLTSATFSPTLQAGIGFGYLDRPELEPGERVAVELHGRKVEAEIVRLPFYKRPK